MNFKKTIIVIIASLSFASSLLSQDCYTDKKHEINLGYFNIVELKSSERLGIGYKYHFNQSAVRFATHFLYGKQDYEELINYQNETSHSSVSYSFNLGYELQTNIDKFQFIYGSDLVIQTHALNYTDNEFIYDNFQYEDVKRNVRTQGYGLSPFVGLKYFINERISISSETKVNILFQKSTSIITLPDNTKITDYKISETIIDIAPLGLITINFHL